MSCFCVNLNRKLLKLFRKSFKNELIYYNNSGMIHWICETFPYYELKRSKEIFIEDERKYINRNNQTSVLHINMNYNDVNIIKNVQKLLYNEIGDFNKVYPATAINYMMFHLLAINNFIELYSNENNFLNGWNGNSFNDPDCNIGSNENEYESDFNESEDIKRIFLE